MYSVDQNIPESLLFILILTLLTAPPLNILEIGLVIRETEARGILMSLFRDLHTSNSYYQARKLSRSLTLALNFDYFPNG